MCPVCVGVRREARCNPGHLSHMPVGTVFYSRAEMEAVGFHGKQMNGAQPTAAVAVA